MTNYAPPPEAVEAAARAMYLAGRTTPERSAAEWEAAPTASLMKVYWRNYATAALTAAGPIIAAQALRGAADALDRDDMTADRWYAAWLRDRAARIARGEGS